MKPADPNLVQRMRRMAQDGLPASQILKDLHRRLPESNRTKFTLIEHFKEAFCLALHEASPIAGWEVEGSGEIPDKRLDELVMPALTGHRREWEASNGS